METKSTDVVFSHSGHITVCVRCGVGIIKPGLIQNLCFRFGFGLDLCVCVCVCCRKGDPFQGLKLGSGLTLGNELSEETHVLAKQEISLGKGTWVESRRVREPTRTALPCGLQSPVSW